MHLETEMHDIGVAPQGHCSPQPLSLYTSLSGWTDGCAPYRHNQWCGAFRFRFLPLQVPHSSSEKKNKCLFFTSVARTYSVS